MITRACRRPLTILLIGSIAFFQSGCSLFDPHVTPASKISLYAPMTSTGQPAAGHVQYAGGVGEAIDYVNDWRSAYYQAVGEQSMLKNGVTLVVVPAAAVAGYFGITGTAGRHVIAGLATGAAGVLGLGTFFESENRQKIYLAGYRAMGCVLFSAGPLLIEQDQYNSLRDDLRILPGKIADLDGAISAAQIAEDDLRRNSSNNEALTRADIEIAAARTLSSTGKTAQSAGSTFVAQVANGRLIIETAAGDIASAVSDQIVDDEPRLSALTEITGGLPGAAQRIATIPPAKKVQKAAGADQIEQKAAGEIDKAQVKILNGQLDLMRNAGDQLVGPANRVQEVVSEHQAASSALQDIKGCGFTPASIGFKITPPDTSISMATGSSKSIMISGGKRPYSAVLAGKVPDGVTLSRSGFDQQPVVAVVTAGATGGEFDLAIADASDADGILVHVTVTEAAPKVVPTDNQNLPPKQNAGAGIGQKKPDKEASLTGVEKTAIQIAVNDTSANGIFTEATWSKIQAFQKENPGLPTDGRVDEKTYAALAKKIDGDWGKIGSQLQCRTDIGEVKSLFECALLTPSLLGEIQAGLKKEPSAMASKQSMVLDPDTRGLIAAFTPKPEGTSAGQSTLNEDLANAILKAAPK